MRRAISFPGLTRGFLIVLAAVVAITGSLGVKPRVSRAATSGVAALVLDVPHDRLYIAYSGSSRVNAVDLRGGEIVATYDLGDDADFAVTSMAINAITGRLYVARAAAALGVAGGVTVVVDTSSRRVLSRIPVTGSLAVNESTNRIYVSRPLGPTSVIDGATHTVVASLPIGGLPTIESAARRLYLSRHRSVTVVDTETNQPIGIIPVPIDNSVPLADPQNHRLILTDLTAEAPAPNLAVIDTVTHSIVGLARIPNGGRPVVPVGPDRLAIVSPTPDGQRMLPSLYGDDGQVTLVGWPAWGQPGPVVGDPTRRRIFVGNAAATASAPNQVLVWSSETGAHPESLPRLPAVDARIAIVWPHGGAIVADANRANVTATIMQANTLASVPLSADYTLRLWRAVDGAVAAPIAVGRRDVVSHGALDLPVWQFDNVDVSAARAPDHRVYFFLTADGVATHSSVWAHAQDARTLFPATDRVAGLDLTAREVDVKIEVVWPHAGAPVEQAAWANVLAYAFAPGTSLAAGLGRSVDATLWRAINGHPAEAVATASSVSRPIDGVATMLWEFNDVDVSAARDPSNRLFFSVTAADVPSRTNVWAHAVDARTDQPTVVWPTTVLSD